MENGGHFVFCQFEGQDLKITPGKQLFRNQHPQITLKHLLKIATRGSDIIGQDRLNRSAGTVQLPCGTV